MEEIQPYILYRLEGGQPEFALWRIKDGPKALALFLSEDKATAYRSAGNLTEEWQILRPARQALPTPRAELLTNHRPGHTQSLPPTPSRSPVTTATASTPL